MQKYRKKPLVIEAIQFDGSEKQAEYIKNMCPMQIEFLINMGEIDMGKIDILILTLEGTMKANKGDWIIKGIADEFYPCKDDIFKKTYEEEN